MVGRDGEEGSALGLGLERRRKGDGRDYRGEEGIHGRSNYRARKSISIIKSKSLTEREETFINM